MALIKTPNEIKVLREGGRILARILSMVADMVRPGISTWELDALAREEIRKAGAEPAFPGYRISPTVPPYPAALCTSINSEVVHGIPQKNKILKEGDIIGLDLGIKFMGLYTDAAVSVPVGKVGTDATRLLEATKAALDAGVKEVKPGAILGEVSEAIENIGRAHGLGVIRDLGGHGVGHSIHEDPFIPNFGDVKTIIRLKPGIVLAIEPMFTLGGFKIKFLDDGWTVVTADGSLAAHFEHTVAVTDEGSLVLTQLQD